MQKTWKYIPFDMPGDYSQSIPVPNSENEFICIQPNSRKDLELQKNEVIGKVNNNTAYEIKSSNDKSEDKKQDDFDIRKLTVEAIDTEE